jgi:lipopolysaccharide export system permease protein
MRPLLLCVSCFAMLFVVFDLFDHVSEFAQQQTSPATIARYYACLLLPTFRYILPASLLLGTLYTLWQKSRHNEITAMRSIGISMVRIMLPFLVTGCFASVLLYAGNETVIPKADLWAKSFWDENELSYSSREFRNTKDGRIWVVNIIDEKIPELIRDVTVTMENPDTGTTTEIATPKASWMDGQWWFFGGEIRTLNKAGGVINIVGIPKLGMEMRDLTLTPDDMVVLIRMQDAGDAKEDPTRFLTTGEIAGHMQANPGISQRRRSSLETDLHNRRASPWSCLIVTFFGIPAGIRGNRQSILSGIYLALGLFFAFHALTQVGIFLGIKGTLTPWLGAWLPNIVFFLTGLVMLVRLR